MDRARKSLVDSDRFPAAGKRAWPDRPRSKRSAFSLVEIIVVVLIMGILAATAVPTFYRSLQYHRLESAARRVKLDLEQAREAARRKSQSQSISFTGPTSYVLSSGVAGMNSAAQTYSVDLSQPPYMLDSVTVNFGGPTAIAFDGYGTASAEGTIVLTSGDETRTITFESSNGDITVSNP